MTLLKLKIPKDDLTGRQSLANRSLTCILLSYKMGKEMTLRQVITSLSIIGTLIIIGCSQVGLPTARLPLIASDGSGGAIIANDQLKGGEWKLYVQRIDPKGNPLWSVPLGSGQKLGMVAADSGSVIILWSGKASKGQAKSISYVTKVDPEGNVLWQRGVSEPDQIISDGSGGAIIGSHDSIVKIDSKGNFPWGKEGISVPIKKAYGRPRTTNDGLGGAIIVSLTAKEGIWAQRVSSNGSTLWSQNGVEVRTKPEEYYSFEGVGVVGDGSGGAIVIFCKVPMSVHNGKLPNGEIPIGGVYAQRISAKGDVLWGKEGIPVALKRGGINIYHSVKVVSDSSGGAIVAWKEFYGMGSSVRVQRIDAEGNILWKENGLPISSGGRNPHFSMVSDDSGGIIIATWWVVIEHRNEVIKEIRVQKIDAIGERRWIYREMLTLTGAEGDSYIFAPVISKDGQEGVLVAWGIGSSIYSPPKRLYIQRIDARGNRLWGEKGIRLNP